MPHTQPATILFLGPSDSRILHWLKQEEESVLQTSEKFSPEYITQHAVSFLVSYGYRHILKPETLDLFPNRAINLHISYLPWNRGADPNFWSFVDDTPKGVSIHYLDAGIDTGDLIVQREVAMDNDETLKSSYARLQFAIEELFQLHWTDIKLQRCPRIPQSGNGSTHRRRDSAPYQDLLKDGWETRVRHLKK